MRGYKATVWSGALLGALIGLPFGLVAVFSAVFGWGLAAVTGAFAFPAWLAVVRNRPTKRNVVAARAVAGGLAGGHSTLFSEIATLAIPIGAIAATISVLKNFGSLPEV
ncbi:MAG: hypothetical protein AB8G99_22450 [Planctomycetaceae bacterium]